MLVPSDRRKQTDDRIAKAGAAENGKLPTAHFNLLKKLTVRLHGSAAKDSFTGSGVVARVDGDNTYILTAKHNLQIFGNSGKKAPAEFVSFFLERITAELDEQRINVPLKAKATITVLDGQVADHGYDVALIQIADRQTATAVRALVADGTEAYAYTSDDWKKGQKTIVKLASLQNSRMVLGNGTLPVQSWEKPLKPNPAAAHFILWHFGYGMVTKPGAYGGRYAFAYRALPIDESPTTYIERTHEGYDEIFVVPATDEDTGLNGDSGGPVFAGQSSRRSIVLGRPIPRSEPLPG